MQNKVSDEERLKLYELCKRELSGKWTEVNKNDLIIRPVTEGLVNKIYYCFLPENIETKYNKVLVRYVDYEQLKTMFEKTHVLAITLILSEKQISPKLLSVFSNGTIVECIYESRYFSAEDYFDYKVFGVLAQKLAKLHSLKIPIPKDDTELTYDVVWNQWFTKELRQSYREGIVRKEIQKHKSKTFLELDLEYELDWLKKTMIAMKSPIVFSHNDFNRRNILIRETNDKTNPEIFVIDFDWSNNNYRGVDIGQYYACFGQIDTDFGSGDYPTDEQMTPFIDKYIEEMTKIFGDLYNKNEINSRKTLIKEAKVFSLFSFIKDIIYFLDTTDKKSITSDFLRTGDQRLHCYSELKTKILTEYPDID